MTKQYPRIYSLSTVGLIHHQEFDYLFHPFRTDFIGESGSGKSIIADLIQLIFVGSEAFESATRGTDTREPEGMVLQAEKRSKGVGYAFLNIEMAPAQYLVVGSYMETGNRSTQAFFIQAGYDWQHIQYLSVPVSFQQVLKEEDILPIDLLTEYLDEQGLHMKAWQRYKEFHKILFREKIVPLDLASSERLLNDYAGILQSFSRGKMLDTHKSDSLKQFLFGNQETRKILDNYKSAEKDMEQAIGEYGHNLQEIERVTSKQKALIDLRELKKQRDGQQHSWLYRNLLFYHQETTRLEKEVNDSIIQYTSALQHQSILKELLADEINRINERLPEMERTQKTAEQEYEAILPRHSQVKQVLDWLAEFNCSYEELGTRYKEYKRNQSEKAVLSPFLYALQQKSIADAFDNIPTKQSAAELNPYLADVIAEREHQIQQKNRLKKYANINDPESLANWALQQKRAFTIEEESAILHFQDLPRKKPADLTDYLPEPAELILSLSVAEKTDNGFWITLNGIRKHIPYVAEQILDTTDEGKIRSYFEQYTNTLDKDVRELEKELGIYQAIQETVHAQDNISLILSTYPRKESLPQLSDIPSLNISEERFQEYQELYLQKATIQEQFTRAKSTKEQADYELRLAKANASEYNVISKTMDTHTKPNDGIRLILDQFPRRETYPDSYSLEKENISASLSRVVNKTDFFRQQGQLIQPALSGVQQLPSLKSSLDSNRTELEKAKDQYLKWYERLPESLETEGYIIEPIEERQKYFEAETTYNTKYSSVIAQYIASEAYRFEDTKDFIELARNLLPEAFYDVVVDQSETNVIDTIAVYLTRINEKNRQLNNRKIQKIKNLLDEVDEIITQQENTIRRIDNFLKSDAQITGGYTARLRKTSAVNYPKTWMSTFKEMIEDEAGTLQNKLGEKIDLAEMMKTAFHNCGGPLHANTTVARLLDPSNYYELSFTMESESGRINKGSTGQTYAAVALLCIARLSIMSSEEGKAAAPAVRIMPIDEAEGLGSNYDMLYDIAQKYDYQLISLSIGPVGKFRDGEQYLYMLHKNMEVEEPVNYTPVAILCESDKMPNL